MSKPRKAPQTYSLSVQPGEALVGPVGRITPTLYPFVVEIREVPQDPAVFQRWFVQSVVALVGEAAAGVLQDLMVSQPGIHAEFLKKAMEFRNRLK